LGRKEATRFCRQPEDSAEIQKYRAMIEISIGNAVVERCAY